MKENNNKTGKRLWLIMMAGGILYILLTLYEKAIHPWYKPELLIFIPIIWAPMMPPRIWWYMERFGSWWKKLPPVLSGSNITIGKVRQ